MGNRILDLAGTSEDDFSVGKEQEHGVRIAGSGEVALYDPINGEQVMSAFLGGAGAIGHIYEIPSSTSLTIPAGRQFDHLGRFTIDGRAVVNGRFTLGL